jgi:hypothetical protein
VHGVGDVGYIDDVVTESRRNVASTDLGGAESSRDADLDSQSFEH